MNKFNWLSYAVVFVIAGAFVLAFAMDREIRKDDPMEEHRCMKAEDISVRCAMRVHELEQRVDLHELRLEEMERMVFGTNFNTGTKND